MLQPSGLESAGAVGRDNISKKIDFRGWIGLTGCG
jgi:hypothetical protein